MTILASFPLYSHPDIANAALASLDGADTLVVCNNPDLKATLTGKHVVNKANNYCNGGWNQAMRYFLRRKEYDWLVLSSQDVILQSQWSERIPGRAKEVYVPSYSSSLELMPSHYAPERELRGGIAGACTLLPRAAVELIYPIPKTLKLWFGDEWMYGRLWKNGWKVMQAPISAYHYGSLSIGDDPHAHAIIEGDKIAWEKVKHTL